MFSEITGVGLVPQSGDLIVYDDNIYYVVGIERRFIRALLITVHRGSFYMTDKISRLKNRHSALRLVPQNFALIQDYYELVAQGDKYAGNDS